MSELYRLIYISRSLIPDHARPSMLGEILSRSRKANHLAGITGILVCSRGYFCQVIEGLLQPLELLFETIQLDLRHTDVTVMEFLPVQARLFARWDMAHLDIDDPVEADSRLQAVVHQLTISTSHRKTVEVFADLITQREAFRA